MKNNDQHVHSNFIVIAVFFLLLIPAVMVTPGFGKPVDDFQEQIERIKAVEQWKITFSYEREYKSESDFGDISGADYERISSSGAALFGKEKPERGEDDNEEDDYYDYYYYDYYDYYEDEEENTKDYDEDDSWGEDHYGEDILKLYAQSGSAEYELEIYHLSRVGEYYVIDTESGSGFADIGIGSIIDFNFNERSYSFFILPVGEGVPSKAFRLSNVTEQVIKEMSEEGLPVIYPDKLRAMFPDKRQWEEFLSSYAVEVSGMNIPQTGLIFKGKQVTATGDTVSWTIEPVSVQGGK
jgi:hypothetical protein